MGMTLSAAQPILQINLYKAFYDAYMSQYSTDPEAGNCNLEAKKSFEKAASKFSQQLSQDMAQAIYDFVKEMSIQAVVTGTIVAPSGPCTGSIPPSNFTII